MASVLTTMQEAAVARLQALPFFAPAPLLYERQKDFRSELEKAVRVLGGVAILVLTPRARNQAPGSGSSTVACRCELVVSVLENVLLNSGSKGTRIGASEWAEQVVLALNNHVWATGKALTAVDFGVVEHPSLLVYNARFETSATLTPQWET